MSTMCCNSLKIGEGFRSYPIGKCFNQRSLTSTTSLKRKNNQKKTFNRLNFEAKNEKEIIHRKVKKKLVGIFFLRVFLRIKMVFLLKRPLEEFCLFVSPESSNLWQISRFGPRLCLYEARLFAPNLIKS